MTVKNKKICNVPPVRAVIERTRLSYVSTSEVTYVLPCGIKYTDRHEVLCGKTEKCKYYNRELL